MLATELLFVYVYCLVDDAIKAGALLIPQRPGPAPACTDAELLTIALVRHLPGFHHSVLGDFRGRLLEEGRAHRLHPRPGRGAGPDPPGAGHRGGPRLWRSSPAPPGRRSKGQTRRGR
jgi:hypothetical protein